MKKVNLILAVGYAGLLCLGTAQAATNLSVGVVNFQQVLQNSSEAKAASQKIENKFRPQKDKIDAKQKAFQDALNDYQKNANTMSAADQQKQQDKLNDMRNDLLKKTQDYQQKLITAQQGATSTVIKDLTAAITKVAKKDQLNMVLFKDAVAYSDVPAVDITNEVIQEVK